LYFQFAKLTSAFNLFARLTSDYTLPERKLVLQKQAQMEISFAVTEVSLANCLK
jgi:hypothetical protein